MSEPIKSFTTAVPAWKPRIAVLNVNQASHEQLQAMNVTTSATNISEFTLALALDPETLSHLLPLLSGIMSGQNGLSRSEAELGAVSASIVNRSIYCAAAHSNSYNQLTEDETVMDSIFSSGEAADISPRNKTILQFATNLSKCPPEAIATDIENLSANGLNQSEILDLVLVASLFGWVNRLSHVLGDPLA